MIIKPYEGDTIPSDSITIEVSSFEIVDGTDAQIATQYRVLDAATNEIAYDTGSVTNFTSQDVPENQLSFDQDYLVQARHKGTAVGWSKWSPTVRFRSAFSAEPFVKKPTIVLPIEGGIMPEHGIKIETSSFSVTGQNDTQTAAQYIAYQGTPNNLIYDSGPTSDFTSKTFRPTGIDFDTPLAVQVRHRGETLGWGEWSDPVTFTVGVVPDTSIVKPAIIKPTLGAQIPEDSIQIRTSPFNVTNGTDDHIASQYKIEDGNGNVVHDSGTVSDLTVYEIAEDTLPLDAQYTLNVRHLGKDLGWSDWSDAISFIVNKVPDPAVAKPTITEPTANTEVLEDSVRIRTSSFYTTKGTDIHIETAYEVQRADNNSVAYETVQATTDLTTHDVPESELTPDITYKIRARHKGESYGWSEWSDFTIFTVGAIPDPTILRPSIDVIDSEGNVLDAGPNQNLTLDTGDFSLELSEFSVENGSDTLVESQYRVDRNDTDETIHDATLTNGFDTHNPPENILFKDVTYKVQGRYKGQDIGYSEWSAPITIGLRLSVLKPQVNKPNPDAKSVSIRPKIKSSTFASEDSDDVHTATKYEIIDPTITSPITRIVYETTTSDLLEHTVPAGSELEKGKTYEVRLKHISSLPTASPWSDFVSFTTEVEQSGQSFITSGTFTIPDGVTSVSAVVVPGTGTSSFGTYVSQEPDNWDTLPSLDWTTISGSNQYRWSFGGDFDLSGQYWVVGGRDSQTQQETVSGPITSQVVSFDPDNIDDGWTVQRSLPGKRRDHATVIDKNGFLWVIGGFDGAKALNSILRLDTRNPSAGWSNVLTLSNRFDFSQASLDLDGNIWVVGGVDGGKNFWNHDVYKITPDVNNPQIEIIPELDIGPSGRKRQAMIVDKNGWLWVVGGLLEPSATTSKEDVWRFDTRNPTTGWEILNDSIPSSASITTPVLTLGPGTYIYYVSDNSLLRMDFDNINNGWVIETPTPSGVIRKSRGFVDSQSRIWIIGGLEKSGVIRADLNSGPNQMKSTSFDVSGQQIQKSGPHGSDGQILKWKNDIAIDPGVASIPVTVGSGDGNVRVIWGANTSFPNDMP